MTWRRWSKQKYGAKKCIADDHSFHSQGERELYYLLKLRERAGEIEDVQVQDHIRFAKGSRFEKTYIVDFKFFDKGLGKHKWAEFKGFEQLDWGWKRACWYMHGPGDLEVWKGPHQKIFLFETIVPAGGVE